MSTYKCAYVCVCVCERERERACFCFFFKSYLFRSNQTQEIIPRDQDLIQSSVNVFVTKKERKTCIASAEASFLCFDCLLQLLMMSAIMQVLISPTSYEQFFVQKFYEQFFSN